MVSAKSLGIHPPIAILSGPTASGKTGLAIDFCVGHTGAPIEIISADSLTVYKNFDIGSAKPGTEERKGIPHHLLSFQDPEERFDAAKFVLETERLITEIHARGHRAMIVGGTGFYLKAFLFGMWDAPAKDEDFRKSCEDRTTEALVDELYLTSKNETWSYTFSKKDRYRIIRALEVLRTSTTSAPFEPERHINLPREGVSVLWIDREEAELTERIEARTKLMLESGLIEEVQSILKRTPHASGLESVGYREVIQFLKGEVPSGRKLRPGTLGLKDEINLATKQLVKKQRTFFKGQILSHAEVNTFVFSFPAEKADALGKLGELYSDQ